MDSFISFLTRTSILAASMVAVVSFGAAADREQVQARLLDQAELQCSNCFFAPSDYYFCFATDDKVLIGYQSVPVINWEDPSKNFLARVHHQWVPWSPPGDTMSISFDAKHIWVERANGKKVKLTRSEPRAVFTHDNRCSAPVVPKSQ